MGNTLGMSRKLEEQAQRWHFLPEKCLGRKAKKTAACPEPGRLSWVRRKRRTPGAHWVHETAHE